MNIQCVILAAGKNTRLDIGRPKSLLEINGISLLERHIRAFQGIGCSQICVVTGHNPNPIHELIEQLNEKLDLDIATVHNDRYDLENGFSLSKAANWIDSKDSYGFFLTMGDHIFQEGFVSEFTNRIMKDQPQHELYLAVDIPSALNAHIDKVDVTKVRVNDLGAILQIGKDIESFNRYDTGLFFMKPEVFGALENCFHKGRYTISSLVNDQISRGEAVTRDIVGYFWNDVDNFNDLTNTLESFHD